MDNIRRNCPMAEKVCDDSDHEFDYISNLYLSKDKDSIVLEVEGIGGSIEHIYLSEANCKRLIERLNVYLND